MDHIWIDLAKVTFDFSVSDLSPIRCSFLLFCCIDTSVGHIRQSALFWPDHCTLHVQFRKATRVMPNDIAGLWNFITFTRCYKALVKYCNIEYLNRGRARLSMTLLGYRIFFIFIMFCNVI